MQACSLITRSVFVHCIMNSYRLKIELSCTVFGLCICDRRGERKTNKQTEKVTRGMSQRKSNERSLLACARSNKGVCWPEKDLTRGLLV